MTEAKKRPAPWSDVENWAICSLYAAMSLRAVNGMEYNKAEMIRQARGQGLGTIDAEPSPDYPLSYRSRGSIEAKLMNLTAVLLDLGLTTYSMERHGYKALSNYQAGLKETAQKYWHLQLAEMEKSA
jgi:hypothetical protein